MSIYETPLPEVFESLKTFPYEKYLAAMEPSTYEYHPEDHPMYGVPRPDLAERNRRRRGTKWPENVPHFNKGRIHSEISRQHMGDARRGSSHSDDTKSKISAAKIATDKDPTIAERRRQARLRQCETIVVNGVVYESRKAVLLALRIGRKRLNGLINEQGFNVVL